MSKESTIDKIIDIIEKDMKPVPGFMFQGSGLSVIINQSRLTCIAIYRWGKVNVIDYNYVINKLKEDLKLNEPHFIVNKDSIVAFEVNSSDDYFNPAKFRKFGMKELLELFTK